MSSQQQLRADVYIAAMPRSGSTMVANLMTAPPWRLMLVEPWIAQGAQGAGLLEQLRRFGWNITDDEYAFRESESVSERMNRLLGHRFAALDAWGCKEVLLESHSPTISLVRPRTVLILVRNLKDVVLSAFEMSVRQQWPQPPSLDELHSVARATSRCLMELAATPEHRTVVVRYEDFVSSAACRSRLQQQLAWGLGGELYRNADLWRRGYEQRRRGTAISAGDVPVSERDLPDGAIEAAAAISEANAEYREMFNYG